ncbi:MAG: ABC transporter substrate-binding protein, partial [Candidatus Promineifilaceae bacterium]
TPPDVFGHVDGYAEGVGLPYNPTQAQQWLADAGYPGGVGLPSITLWFNLGRYDYDYYQAIVDSWYATLGVSVTVQTLPWQEYLDYTNGGDAQVWRLGWIADYLEAHNFLADAINGNSGRFGGWSSGAYDTLIDQAANEPDPVARASLYEQAEEILVETEAVMAPVYYLGNRVASKPFLQRTIPPSQYDLAKWRVLTDTAVIDAGGGLLPSSDGRVAIEVPPGGVAESTELTLFPISWTPPAAALAKVGQAYGLHAHTLAGDPAGPPAAPYLMHITYGDDEISGLDEASVALYSWDGAQWQRENSSVDTGTNTVSAAVDHFSLFALMTAPDQLPVRLDLNLQFEPTAPDPALVSDAAGSVNLVEQLFLGLVTEDDETGVILPELATSWDISPDGLVYTFTLRNDAYWTDGNLVTADDVRNGILRSLDPATNAPFAYLLFAIENGGDYHDEIISDPDLVGVEALDPTTLRISLTGPTAHFLHILAMPVAHPVPQWAIDAYGEAWTEPGNIVSNGPFSFAETLPDDRLRLEKNPDYYDAGNVQIEEVLVWFAGTSTDALTLYQADQLDTTALDDGLGLDAESAQEFRSDPRACNYYYGFSTSEPPFDNALVRRAFSAAIDRAGLIDDLGLSEAPAVTYTPHGVFGHIDGYAEGVGLPYNAAEAQGWLADAGYPGGAGLPPITLWFNESAGHQAIAEQARASWYNTLGVSVTLQSLPWEDYLDFTETGAAQIWRLGWCADYLEAQNFLANSVYGNINRLGGWSNPAYDSLLDLALAQPDEAARLDLYRQAEEILVETDAVLAPIYHSVADRVTRPYLDRTYPAGSISIAPWQTSKVRAVIGPGGGDLVSYDSTVVVSIPAGAFADTVVLSQAPATGMPPDPG